MKAASEFEVLRMILLNQAQILNALSTYRLLEVQSEVQKHCATQAEATIEFVKDRFW